VWKKLATIEQLATMSDNRITVEINELLVPQHGIAANLSPADLAAAQFYIAELDRRKDARAQAERDRIETERWRIDQRNERIIIGLIGIEILLAIGLAIWGDRRQTEDVRQQLEAFGRMQTVLSHLETNSEATMKQSQETAKILETLAGTMEATKNATQGQLAVSYDPSVLVRFIETHKFQVLNNGHTNITLWGSQLGGQESVFLATPTILPPNGGYEFDAEALYQQSNGLLGLPSKSVPYEIYIKNALGHKFVVECRLTPINDNGQVRIVTEMNKITARDWQKH
jgi:hypothetical protein